MPHLPVQSRDLERECLFTATRSSGPGGQNVNKVSTRMELRFDVPASALLDDWEKTRIREKLGRYLTQESVMILVSQSERTQLGNKKKVYERFLLLLERALIPERKRIPTRPSNSSRQRRLDDKRHRGLKKNLRQAADTQNS
jgi:ribosome-associated protein